MEIMGQTLQPNAGTYTVLFDEYARHNKMEEAKQFLKEMKVKGFVFDRKAMRAIRQVLKGKEHICSQASCTFSMVRSRLNILDSLYFIGFVYN